MTKKKSFITWSKMSVWQKKFFITDKDAKKLDRLSLANSSSLVKNLWVRPEPTREENLESFNIMVFPKNMLERLTRHNCSSLFCRYISDKEKSYVTWCHKTYFLCHRRRCKKGRPFVPGKLFHPIQIFVSKTRANPSTGPLKSFTLVDLPKNIRRC